MEKVLSSFGLTNMGDVKANMQDILCIFTPANAEFLLHTSIGVGSEEGKPGSGTGVCDLGIGGGNIKVEDEIGRKSLGAERTFSLCCESITEQKQKLHELCEKVSSELQEESLLGLRVTLKLKTIKFELITRSITSKVYFQSAESIENLALKLLEAETLKGPLKIRLMGITISKFKSKIISTISTNFSNFFMVKNVVKNENFNSNKNDNDNDNELEIDGDGCDDDDNSEVSNLYL
jgi:hypothetical protein